MEFETYLDLIAAQHECERRNQLFDKGGSVGPPVPNMEIIVVVDDGAQLGPNDQGTLYFRNAMRSRVCSVVTTSSQMLLSSASRTTTSVKRSKSCSSRTQRRGRRRVAIDTRRLLPREPRRVQMPALRRLRRCTSKNGYRQGAETKTSRALLGRSHRTDLTRAATRRILMLDERPSAVETSSDRTLGEATRTFQGTIVKALSTASNT